MEKVFIEDESKVSSSGSSTNASGSNYGNGGLGNGPGVGPAALAFLALMMLQSKYQEILQAKADLSTAAAKGSYHCVKDQNEHYSNEVQAQANEQYVEAVSSGINAGVTGLSLASIGPSAFKAVGKAGVEFNEADGEHAGLVKLHDGIKPGSIAERGIGIEEPPLPDDVNERIIEIDKREKTDRALQCFKNGDLKTLANEKDYDSEIMGRVGAKIRGEMHISSDEENTATFGAKNIEEFEQNLETKINQKLMSVNIRAQQLTSAMMRVKFTVDFVRQALEGASSLTKGLIKAQGAFGIESLSKAHNKQQLDMLYSSLAQQVMQDQMSQVTKAWDLQVAVVTNILKALADSQRM